MTRGATRHHGGARPDAGSDAVHYPARNDLSEAAIEKGIDPDA